MAHPVFWPGKIFFYPIGNTSAVCLTSELPPEQPADILLLGCGDARNVLYTVYADLGAQSRPLDFTCCDIDPAISARNILLYTLVTDFPSEQNNEYLQKIWNFYYHFFIDKETLDMVLKQCQVLLDLSPDIDTWNNSKYGAFLRFSSFHSLSSVRKNWALYIGTKNFSKSEMDSLRAEFRNACCIKDDDENNAIVNMTPLRSAGPLCYELYKSGPEQFDDRYWKTGVTFDEPAKMVKANEINPTFAYSVTGKGFALQHGCGSDPILSFHLAEILAPVSGSQLNKAITTSGLVKGAIEEFRRWCLAFNKRVKEGSSLIIRFLVGNAITACRALHYCAINSSIDPGLYAAPWTTALMKLDGGDYAENASTRAPLQFNVIDTSNLTDHIGFLNVLVPCRPLMQTKPSSIIFTNKLATDDVDDGMTPSRDFLELLCGDLSVFAMILDLIPVSYISNFTSQSDAHERAAAAPGSGQFHRHIAWRIGTLSDSTAIGGNIQLNQHLKFDEEQLTNFIYGVYLNMFPNEDNAWIRHSDPASPRRRLVKLSKVHYTRFTLAYLLRFMKDRIDVNWEDVMGRFHDVISRDRRLVWGSNNIQDLFCGLHLSAHSFGTLLPNFNENLEMGPLKGWKSVPPVVCISFEVPRKSFDILEKLGAERIGNPILLCSVMGATTPNVFSYQSFWGKVKAEYGEDSSQEPKIAFEEDPEGIRGLSPAVFTFYVPSHILASNGPQKVLLSIQHSPLAAKILAPPLGPSLILFSVELTERGHVHITRERPGNSGELQKLQNISFAQPTVEGTQRLCDPVKVTLDSANREVAFLTGRVNIQDLKAKAALANGATVSVNQISPRAMQISIGNNLQNIAYPFPINSTDSRTRIARKSSYVEIDVNISGPLEKLGMSLKPFPVIQQDKTLSLWNIHYLDLGRLPVLDLSSSNRLSFLPMHISMSYADRERRLCAAESEGRIKTSDLDVITRLKQSIQNLFVDSSGLGEVKRPVIGLTDPENGSVYTLIFTNGICLDLASHTVVIDACVLPLTLHLASRLINAFGRVERETGLAQILTKPDEVKAWKHLLPAFTERCRKWPHTANCEYLSKGVPVSEETYQSPLCSCGQGKNLGSFTQKKNWKEFAPYVTRAAISPLFAVPFIDTIDEDARKAFHAAQNKLCGTCHSTGKPKLLLCTACKHTSYCSTECQKADWKAHKKLCKELVQLRNSGNGWLAE
ncbi:hypothetical protein F5887DRAFT_597878 [Amanita rubescens]|nr:hypothetical protein F5887DRAFT_597878 [Amanita rubescens]